MSSMASFTAPLLFAGEKRILTLQIFQTKLNGDVNLAAAQSVLLTFVSLGLYAVMMSVGGTPQTARGGKGVARRGVLPVPPILRRLLVGGTFLLLLAELLPVAMIVLLSFVREGSWTTQLLPDRYATQNYLSLLGERKMLEPLLNSLLCAGIAVIGSILFGVSAAVLASRAQGRFWGKAANIILTLPYAVPGTVVAIALIVSFNIPRWWTGGMGLVGTFWILPFAYIMREYPVVVRSVTASLETMDGSLLDAADGLGASAWKRFRSVLLPAIAPAILSGAVLVAIASLGEFVSSIMLYTYASRPVSVEILAQLRQFNIGAASAYAVCLMLLILLILWIPSFLGRGGSGRENVTAMMDSSF
jgi:iron(III) transport system permease protein